MRTIATLQAPDGGTITFGGAPIFADPTVHRGRLGYLPQDFGVYPGISALDLLDHLALLKGLTDRTTRRAQVEALLARITPIGRRGMAAWRTLSRQLLAAYQESAVARPTPQFTTNQPLRPRAAVRPAAVSAASVAA